jgi:hypothetical protein
MLINDKNITIQLSQLAFLSVFFAGFAGCNNKNDEERDETKNMVINEILSKNTQHGSDNDGELDDGIKLFYLANGDFTCISGLHTNYKLSAHEENVVLLSPSQKANDLVEYPATVLETYWASTQRNR